MKTIVINKIEELRLKIEQYKKDGKTIGIVPTMGALHKGHESLIEKSIEISDVTIVSIFVNPIQFGPNEDFEKYPRTLEKDSRLCESLGVDIIFAPSICEMYKTDNGINNNNFTYVMPGFDYVDKLCGKMRAGHFDGVATVVTKLFNITQANFAFFGLKDAQQVFIIEKVVEDLNIPIEIVQCPIVREFDGLALSSRNTYLSAQQRAKALTISRSLFRIEEIFKIGEKNTDILFEQGLQILDKSIELEYLKFVSWRTLEKVSKIEEKTLVAIAVKIDNVRLIDNIMLG